MHILPATNNSNHTLWAGDETHRHYPDLLQHLTGHLTENVLVISYPDILPYMSENHAPMYEYLYNNRGTIGDITIRSIIDLEQNVGRLGYIGAHVNYVQTSKAPMHVIVLDAPYGLAESFALTGMSKANFPGDIKDLQTFILLHEWRHTMQGKPSTDNAGAIASEIDADSWAAMQFTALQQGKMPELSPDFVPAWNEWRVCNMVLAGLNDQSILRASSTEEPPEARAGFHHYPPLPAGYDATDPIDLMRFRGEADQLAQGLWWMFNYVCINQPIAVQASEAIFSGLLHMPEPARFTPTQRYLVDQFIAGANRQGAVLHKDERDHVIASVIAGVAEHNAKLRAHNNVVRLCK